MPDVKPTLLTASMATRALGDQQFYIQVPEFLPIRQKVSQMHIELSKGRGCSGCKKRRIQRNLFGDFVNVLLSLNPAGVVRLKKYYGVPALMLNMRERQTKQQKVHIL